MLRLFRLMQAAAFGREKASHLQGLPTGALIALLAVVYFGLAKLGLSFAEGSSVASAVWPPMGVALGASVMLGYRVLPGITIGAFAANATGDSTLVAAGGIAVANTCGIALSTWLLQWNGFQPALRRIRDVVLLALPGAIVTALVNATVANGILWAQGDLEVSQLWESWRVWSLGDFTGILLFTPPVLLLLNPWEKHRRAVGRVAETTLGMGLMAAVTILILKEGVTLAYPVFPMLVLIGMRYRQPGAVISAMVVSALAIFFTARGEGPFIGGSSSEELLEAQMFVAFAAVTALMVAAARTELERSEHVLRELSESQGALAEAQGLAHIGSWEWDLRTNEVAWTEELYRIFAINPESFELTYTSYMDGIHPEDRGRMERAIRESTENNAPFTAEHRIIRPDGEERYLFCHGRLVVDGHGNQTKMIGTAQDVTERRDAEHKLSFLAMHDQLTGLPNRALFVGRLEQALTRPGDTGPAVLFCDLDNFKVVNDQLGHEAGDELLASLAPRLGDAVRPNDLVARLGGDEFVVLLEQYEDQAEVMNVARRLSAAFDQPAISGGRKHHLSASIGIVFARPGEMTASEVLRDADAAMYQAKEAGQGVISIFDDELRDNLVRRLEIENDLRHAIRRNELKLVYQPVFAIDSRQPIGVEALLRWRHPEWGLLLPNQFIEIAERNGMIHSLGRWVLDRACHDAAEWIAESSFPDLTVSVNVSASQASDSSLPAAVEEALRSSGLPAERLGLEITESALLEQGSLPIENLYRLREVGVHLLLDDFGTGYSSLSYLRRMPITALKVDREFIIDLGKREESTAIVAAILSMSVALDLEIVAEGVESEEQLEWLRERGCRLVQGNYLSEPLTPRQLRSWIPTAV